MKEKQNNSEIIHLTVFLALTFGVGFIPCSFINPLGMRIIGIFAGVIYGWTFLGFIIPSLLGMVALGICGYYKSAIEAYTVGFANATVVYLFMLFPFLGFLQKSGLDKKMAHYFLSRKIVLGRPWIFTLVVLFAALIISFAADSLPALFIIWSMLYGIFRDVGYKKGDAYPAFLCYGVAIAIILNVCCKPWSTINVLITGALASVSNGALSIPYGPWMAATIPFSCFVILGYVLLGKYVFRLDVSPLMNITEAYLEEIRSQLTLNKIEKIALAAILVYVVMLLLSGLYPVNAPGYAFLHQFDFLFGIAVIVAVLSILKVDGKPIMNFVECAKDGMSWEAVWMTVVAVIMGNVLSSDEAGLMPLLANFINTTFTDTTIWLFVICFILVLAIATQASHNTTMVIIGVPIAYTVCQSMGLNPIVFAVLVGIGAAIAFATPAACVISALGFANTEWIGVKAGFKYGISAFVVGIIGIYLIALPLCVMLFGLSI